MAEKRVSILMGIYNCADTLDEAIESIINQTYTDWQLIMCDDGSKDNTFEVAERYVKEDPERFLLVKNEQNMGLNFTLNRCLELAKGEYVARMDGDDISLPDRLQKEVDFLDANPEYAIVSGSMILFDDEGDRGIDSNIEKPQVLDFIKHSPFFNHAPCMIRRDAFLAVDGYTVDKKLLRFEDCNLWYKLYGKGYRGYNFQEPIYKMRDDRNAFRRRTFSSRMRAVYVDYVGFRLVKIPFYCYPALLYVFFKHFVAAVIPFWLYKKLRK